jgi:hypothetical protein
MTRFPTPSKDSLLSRSSRTRQLIYRRSQPARMQKTFAGVVKRLIAKVNNGGLRRAWLGAAQRWSAEPDAPQGWHTGVGTGLSVSGAIACRQPGVLEVCAQGQRQHPVQLEPEAFGI